MKTIGIHHDVTVTLKEGCMSCSLFSPIFILCAIQYGPQPTSHFHAYRFSIFLCYFCHFSSRRHVPCMALFCVVVGSVASDRDTDRSRSWHWHMTHDAAHVGWRHVMCPTHLPQASVNPTRQEKMRSHHIILLCFLYEILSFVRSRELVIVSVCILSMKYVL